MSKGLFSASVPGTFIQHYAVYTIQYRILLNKRTGHGNRNWTFILDWSWSNLLCELLNTLTLGAENLIEIGLEVCEIWPAKSGHVYLGRCVYSVKYGICHWCVAYSRWALSTPARLASPLIMFTASNRYINSSILFPIIRWENLPIFGCCTWPEAKRSIDVIHGDWPCVVWPLIR